MKLTPVLIGAMNAHAIADFPNESCGIIVAGAYLRCTNVAEHPERDFVIHHDEILAASKKGAIEAFVHSHPNGPLFPTEADMVGQIATARPWIIIPTDGERCAAPTFWGDSLPIAPLIGRSFMHGVSDCYSLVRDTFRKGREGCAEEGVTWPLPPITLPEVPRDDEWWGKPGAPGKDLYADGVKNFGFKVIDRSEVVAGDCFLAKIRSERLNHAGCYIGDNLILHHLPMRLSRREPAGIWARAADLWVRYVG